MKQEFSNDSHVLPVKLGWLVTNPMFKYNTGFPSQLFCKNYKLIRNYMLRILPRTKILCNLDKVLPGSRANALFLEGIYRRLINVVLLFSTFRHTDSQREINNLKAICAVGLYFLETGIINPFRAMFYTESAALHAEGSCWPRPFFNVIAILIHIYWYLSESSFHEDFV